MAKLCVRDTLADHWSREAIVYHIYPRSFHDTSGDGNGDLRGIIEKLDYLNDGTENSLGINTIWISPIYTSPFADGGYDVSNFTDIDPIFGDMNTFDTLIKEAHARGIRVLMDFIPNHTSNRHPWFIESRSSEDNPKRDWYVWQKGRADGTPPNNWLSRFGGSAWKYDKATDSYYLHTFLKEQPDLNWYNPHVREAMKAILHFWLEKGVDGFRTDAMHHLLYDPEFNDDPRDPKYDPAIHPQYGSLIHSNSQYANMLPEITQTFCEALDRPKKGFMFSESYIQIPEMERLYHACNNHLHAPLNFHLLKLPWSAATYRTFIDTFESSLSPDDIPTYVLGNHDTVRVATRLGQDRARVAAMLLLTLRGIPFIYYGDEIGMENAVVTKAQAHDPLTKTTLPNQPGRDGCRTPMQWSPSSYAGFSETRPWLPVATSYRQYNVESERSLPGSMLSLYAKLIHLRKQSPALTRGSYHSKTVSNPHIFSFIREYKKEKMVIILNFSPEAQIYTYTHAPGTILCSTYMDSADTIPHGKEIVLRASEGIIIHIT